MWASLWNIYDGPRGAPDVIPKSTARVRSSEESKESGDDGRRMDELTKNNFIPSSNVKQIINLQEAADNTIILRGIIFGEEQSGKTSLIRRLRGENPFQQPENDESISRETGRKVMALLPWRIPNEVQFHKSQVKESDGLVQLYVSEGKSFCYSKNPNLLKKQMTSLFMHPQRGKGFDFAVWMVDPRMNKVLDFVQEGLEILFPSVTEQEKSCCEGKEILVENSKPIIQHVCILVNFRDAIPAEQLNDSNEGLLFEQIQLVVKNVVARHKECYEKHRRGVSSDALSTPTILVYESSMKNYYGLQDFHSFIASPYLSRKERDLRDLAEQTYKQRLVCERGLMEAKRMEYGEFIKQKMREKEQSQRESLKKVSIERPMLKEEKKRIQTHLDRQKEILRTTTENQEVKNHVGKDQEGRVDRSSVATNLQHFRPDKQLKQDIAPATGTDSSDQQKVFVKRQLISDSKKAATTATGRTTLESFFSDDDDEDDEQTEIETCDTSESSEGYDSDDGDFYIDSSGARCVHANLPVRGRQSSSKLDVTPRHRHITKEVNNETAENDSSVLHDKEVDSHSSNVGKGVHNEMSPPEAENSINNPYPVEESKSSAECATGTQISASEGSDSQKNVENYTLTDSEVGEKSLAYDSVLPLGTIAEERVEERTTIDATATLDYKDGTPTSNEQLPEGSVIATDNDDTCIKETLKVSDDEFKSKPVESEIESGVKNDEESEKHSSAHRHRTSDEHLVLNSDEESIGQSRNGYRVSNDDCDDIAELNNPIDVNQDSTTNLSLPRRTGNRGKALPVSSAALAAIEAAKIEAEKLMARSQSDESQAKRESKSKKKDKEGKKKKKKDKDKVKKQDK